MDVPNGSKIGYVTSFIAVIIIGIAITLDIITYREQAVKILKRNLTPVYRRWKAFQFKQQCICCRTSVKHIDVTDKVDISDSATDFYIYETYNRTSIPVTPSSIRPDIPSQPSSSYGSDVVDVTDLESETFPPTPPKPVSKLAKLFFAQRETGPLYDLNDLFKDVDIDDM